MRIANPIIASFLFLITSYALPGSPAFAEETEHGDHGMGDMFVHPFLAHMALPDKPGEVSLRISPFQQREGESAVQDLSFHIEAGLLPRLGLHIRSDAVKTESYSEIMLMYALVQSQSLSRGVGIFGQLSLPTGSVESNTYKGLFGASVRETIPDVVVIDANSHVNLKDKMAEYESSFVFKASDKFYPTVEVRGEITEDGTTAYSLLGLKFRVADEMAWGVGYQFALTDKREYDSQLLGTFGIAF